MRKTMKRYLPVLVLLISLGTTLCLAQTEQPVIKDDFKPSTLNQPGQEYPRVNSQGHARFRISAPQAQSVTLSLGLGGRGGPGGGRGGFGGDPKANADALKQAGINSIFYVSPDTAQEFQSWRRSLGELAPLLFKD
jgi:hypothetical protein